MRKLNQRKIRWIVREMDKEEMSVYWIAKNMTIQYRVYHTAFKASHAVANFGDCTFL